MSAKKIVTPLPPIAKLPAINSAQYIWAVVAVVLVVGSFASAIIVFRPDADIALVLTVSFGFASMIITNIFATMKSQEASTQAQAANSQAQETHVLVNSRMSEAVSDAARAAYSEGLEAGRKLANERNDMLNDKKQDKRDE
jgi:hypothetical protein